MNQTDALYLFDESMYMFDKHVRHMEMPKGYETRRSRSMLTPDDTVRNAIAMASADVLDDARREFARRVILSITEHFPGICIDKMLTKVGLR